MVTEAQVKIYRLNSKVLIFWLSISKDFLMDFMSAVRFTTLRVSLLLPEIFNHRPNTESLKIPQDLFLKNRIKLLQIRE